MINAIKYLSQLQNKSNVMNQKISDISNIIAGSSLGANGQLVKIINGKFTPSNNFNVVRAATNSTVQTMKSMSDISLKEVFNQWTRFTTSYYSDTGVGVASQNGLSLTDKTKASTDEDACKAGWTYDDTTKLIANNGNFNSTGGFISNNTYDQYSISMNVSSAEADDDFFGFVVGYILDDKGIFHHISVIRHGGDQLQNWGGLGVGMMKFCLMYDFDMPTGIILQNKSADVGVMNFLGSVKLSVERIGKHVTAKTSMLNGDYIDPKIDYVLPDINPGYPEDSWNNIKKILTNFANVGFLTKSENSKFNITSQKNLFTSSDIYNIDTNEVLSYNSTEWVKTGTVMDNIQPRSWLFNDATGQLFWFEHPGMYYEIGKSKV